MNNNAWICPKCGRVWSPAAEECLPCNGKAMPSHPAAVEQPIVPIASKRERDSIDPMWQPWINYTESE